MLQIRRLLSVAIAAMLVASLAACNGSSNNSTTSSEAPAASGDTASEAAPAPDSVTGDEVDLRVIFWGSQTRVDYTQAAMDVFTEQNPNITFSPEMVSWDGYWQRLATMSASSNLPDVLQQDYKYITQYTVNGLIEDLVPYMESGLLDLSDSPESMWDSGYVNGKLVAICLGVNSMSVVANPVVFEAAGIDYPDDNWSYADYQAMLAAFHEKKDEIGISYPEQAAKNNAYELISAWMREQGISFFNTDGTNSFGWEKEEGKAIILDWIAQEKVNIESGYSAPLALRDEVDQDGIESGLIVRDGTALATGFWSNQVSAISNAAGHNLKLLAVPDPTPGAQKLQYIKPSQFFSVASNSEHKEEAVYFISEFTNNVDMNMELKAERGVPIANKVREALAATYDEDSIELEVFNYVGRIGEIAGPTPVPEPSAYNAISELLQNLVKNIIDQGADPDSAFDDFYNQAVVEFEMAAE